MENSKEFKIKITQSPEMIKRLGEETYTTPEDAIDELVQNGMDAGAKNIRIGIGQNKIVFEDDGMGFSKERFNAFCTQGTSYKKKHPKVKGKTVAGNKGIGRYAIFKLTNLCEARSKIKSEVAYYWKIDNNSFFAGNNCKFIETIWNKPYNNGTEFLMTNLTDSGKELSRRTEKLKQLIIRNWDVEKTNIFVNNEKLLPELINYEEDFVIYIDEKINNIYVKGKIGLTTREGNINGVLIKVNNRGVGKPKLFGIENMGRYGLLTPRLRGVLYIDSFADIINVSRNDFLETPKYSEVTGVIKDKIIVLLEKKKKKKKKEQIGKVSDYLKKIFKELNKVLNDIFKKREGVFKSLTGKYNEDEKGNESYDLDEGEERGGEGKGGEGDNPSKDIIGIKNIKPNKEGKLKIGKYNWDYDIAPKGIEEKLVVVEKDILKVVVNTDHPAFKLYTKPSNKIFLFMEVIYSLALQDEDFTKEKVRQLIDESIRNIMKNDLS